jgi:hypothetical protein
LRGLPGNFIATCQLTPYNDQLVGPAIIAASDEKTKYTIEDYNTIVEGMKISQMLNLIAKYIVLYIKYFLQL